MNPDLPLIVSSWEWGKPANEEAAETLARGGSALAAVEKGVNRIELDSNVRNVGYGSIPNEHGVLELDAAIMDGRAHCAGAVACLEKIPNPISVARRVMEKTTHVLLCGHGALEFALREGFTPQNLLTAEALAIWNERRSELNRRSFRRDTVAHSDTLTMILLDRNGDIAAGGSTSGLALKIPGRVSDVCVIGGGIYAENGVGAAAATGNGDEIMKFCVSIRIVDRIRSGASPQDACQSVIRWVLELNPETRDTQFCVFALDAQGRFGAASIRRAEFPFAVWSGGKSEILMAASML